MIFFQHQFHAMGTMCQIHLYADSNSIARQATTAVIADIERLEQKYSRYRSNSYLSKINHCAKHGNSITVDEETAALLNYADTCFQQSGGLFDISSGLLRHAWNMKSGKSQIPSSGKLANLLARVGWQKLIWEQPVLSFPTPGMEMDLGGVVKEYAADRAANICREHQLSHGLINLGGDITVIGPHADGTPWTISIKQPADNGSNTLKIVLSNGALASSGDYERFLMINRKRYGHILNPLTGWPTRHLSAVSVQAEFCLVAGSSATIAMLKEAEGKNWLADLGTAHLWIDSENRVHSTFLYAD